MRRTTSGNPGRMKLELLVKEVETLTEVGVTDVASREIDHSVHLPLESQGGRRHLSHQVPDESPPVDIITRIAGARMWPQLEMREGGVMIGKGNLQAMIKDQIIGPALIFCIEVKLPKLIEDLTVLTKTGDLISIRNPLITGEKSLDIRTELKLIVITDDLKVLDTREVNVQTTKKDLAVGEKVQILRQSDPRDDLRGERRTMSGEKSRVGGGLTPSESGFSASDRDRYSRGSSRNSRPPDRGRDDRSSSTTPERPEHSRSGRDNSTPRRSEHGRYNQKELRLKEACMKLDRDKNVRAREYPVVKDPYALTNDQGINRWDGVINHVSDHEVMESTSSYTPCFGMNCSLYLRGPFVAGTIGMGNKPARVNIPPKNIAQG